MHIRPLAKPDFDVLTAVIDDWWQAPVRHLWHPTLLYQFGDTAFVAEDDSRLCGFVAGFISQTDPREAYIHLVAVVPTDRRRGTARALYAHFFAAVAARDCERVKAITRPTNRGSIAFHLRLGFELVEDGSVEIDGVQALPNYSGPGVHRVVFVKALRGGRNVTRKEPTKKRGTTPRRKAVAKKAVKRSAVPRRPRAAHHRALAEASPEQCFWVNFGPVLKNLRELREALATEITEAQFAHHVSAGRNDFAAWVEGVLHDPACAQSLRRARTRAGALRAVKAALARR